MTKTRSNTYQQRDYSATYCENAQNYVDEAFGKHDHPEAPRCSTLLSRLGILALPITATIGAGFKTIEDHNKRELLLQDDIDNTINLLQKSNVNTVNNIVESILQSHLASSESCKTLRSKLQATIDEKDPENAPGSTLFKSSPRPTITENQAKLICDYLQDPVNAGKKLQHVIVKKATSIRNAEIIKQYENQPGFSVK